jgi:hypothetical protein
LHPGALRERVGRVTGLEILNKVALGETLFHRDDDAWDLLDTDGLVAAVLCPRTHHLSISPPRQRVRPVPAGRRIPYGEKVEWKITEEMLDDGVAIVRRLAASPASLA